jgi:hypothetical protein
VAKQNVFVCLDVVVTIAHCYGRRFTVLFQAQYLVGQEQTVKAIADGEDAGGYKDQRQRVHQHPPRSDTSTMVSANAVLRDKSAPPWEKNMYAISVSADQAQKTQKGMYPATLSMGTEFGERLWGGLSGLVTRRVALENVSTVHVRKWMALKIRQSVAGP